MSPQNFGCRVSITLLVGEVCPLRVTFVILPNRLVDPIYVVNVVAAVLFCVDIYVYLLPHILAWSYQLFVFGNPTLVGCHNTSFQSSPHQLGRIA